VSEQPPDIQTPVGAPGNDGRTEEYPTVATGAPPPDSPAWTAEGDGNADEEWIPQTTRGIRLGVPIAALCALVLVAGGFWGGAELEKSHAGGAGSATLAGFASRLRSAIGGTGATGASGFRGFAGAGAGATTGTISVVDGDTLYVETSSGLVKVTLSKSTTITRNANAAADDLRPGDTVVVEGATGSGGAVSATSVSATAPGVTSGFAGRGFAGFGGAGTGATGSTTSNTTTTPSLFGG